MYYTKQQLLGKLAEGCKMRGIDWEKGEYICFKDDVIINDSGELEDLNECKTERFVEHTPLRKKYLVAAMRDGHLQLDLTLRNDVANGEIIVAVVEY